MQYNRLVEEARLFSTVDNDHATKPDLSTALKLCLSTMIMDSIATNVVLESGKLFFNVFFG